MPSTVIRRHAYSSEERALVVEFVTGRRYVYLDVPNEAYAAFCDAFSKGRYFNAHIRDHYKFKELASS